MSYKRIRSLQGQHRILPPLRVDLNLFVGPCFLPLPLPIGNIAGPELDEVSTKGLQRSWPVFLFFLTRAGGGSIDMVPQ